MAIVGNPYAKYQNSKILTASPAELTLMLYDGVIKFVNIAIGAIDEKNYEKANNNIIKAERIIDHLSATLNDKYPVSKDFENIYGCIMQALIQGNIKKNKDELERALEYTRMIRDTWKEVMKLAEKGSEA
ncbi:MAG: flagellar export chaperone FliS [Lachnospiraceae bacterium]|nr:flagellar export chaperone FliS [Lachnospiraceae bacterium]